MASPLTSTQSASGFGIGFRVADVEHHLLGLGGDRQNVGHSHHDRSVPRILLLLPTSTYRAPDFVRAATRLGVEVVVGSDEMPILMEGATERAVVVPLDEPEVAADLIVALDDRRGVDAVVAVDDRGVLVAAAAGERLGFPHNPPDAVAATRDKAAMRRALARGRGAPAHVRGGR